MTLEEPVVAYTAKGNLDAHLAAIWLQSKNVRAHAVEDHSSVSLHAFGTISQFHKPQVFVDAPDYERALELLLQFEQQRDARRRRLNSAPAITSECEQCGDSSDFPASQNGTTQNCPKCRAFMDVGTFEWPDDFDFGVADSELASRPETIEEALDIAIRHDKDGDWNEAIAAYRCTAELWPEHVAYINNCIAEVERKRDIASS